MGTFGFSVRIEQVDGTVVLRPSGELDVLTAPQVAHWRYANRHEGRPPDPPLYLRHLERMRDTSYQQILDRVGAILKVHPLVLLDVALLVDCTEVGRTVVDRLRITGLPGVGVTLTAGDHMMSATLSGRRSASSNAPCSADPELVVGRRRAPDRLAGSAALVARRAGRGPETGPVSFTVMTDEQFLQRILRILPRTLSSAIEYRVLQRSQ